MQQKPQHDDRFDSYKNGAASVQSRGCTDVICCLLFTVNIVAMVGVAIYAYTNGDTNNIYRATDNSKNICGQTGSLAKDYPYSYFFNPSSLDVSNRICVKQCPTYRAGTLSTVTCFTNAVTASCAYTLTINEDGTTSRPLTNSDFVGYDTTSVIGRVCVPTSKVLTNAFSSFSDSMSKGLRQSAVANFVTDLQNNWQWLLLSLVLAVLLSVFLMFMLRCLAGCLVWGALIVLQVTLIGTGVIFLYNGGVIPKDSFIGNLGITVPTLPDFQYYNIFGYVTLALALILLLFICCCCSKIRLAVELTSLAGKFISQVCQVVFVPIVMGLLVFAWWVACIIALVYLIGAADFEASGSNVFTSIKSYTDKNLGLFYYFVFGTLWGNAFIQAFAVFIVAFAGVMWYYQRAPGNTLDSPVCSGVYAGFRYHLGSLAFGSLIQAIIQFIQFLFEVLNKQLQANGAASNACYDFAKNCIRCCLECFKRIVQCINRYAYIVIAVTGKNYCSASSDVMSLMLSNALRFSFVQSVGTILTIFGKLVVSAGTTALFYVFITFVKDVKANVQQPIFLLILVFIGAYAISVVFMCVYYVGVETLLICFLVDEKSNKKAIYSPPELQQHMDY